MVRKRVFSVATVSIMVMILASPVSAKMVPTETEVSVDGTTALVTVNVESHDGELPQNLDGMFALYRADALDGTGRPVGRDQGIPLDLRLTDQNTYQTTIEIPESGEWAVVPFPGDNQLPADVYPTTPFTLLEPSFPGIGSALLAGLVVLVAVGLVWGMVRRVGRPSQEPSMTDAAGG